MVKHRDILRWCVLYDTLTIGKLYEEQIFLKHMPSAKRLLKNYLLNVLVFSELGSVPL